MDKVNLLQKFDLVTEYWSPKIVGELNGQQVKLAKFKGEFIWHHHDAEDEQGRDRIILVRDPIGTIPLYHTTVGAQLLLAGGVEHLEPLVERVVHAAAGGQLDHQVGGLVQRVDGLGLIGRPVAGAGEAPRPRGGAGRSAVPRACRGAASLSDRG